MLKISKFKALVLGLLCIVLTVELGYTRNMPFFWLWLAAALLFLCIYTVKRNRDVAIERKAAKQRRETVRIARPTRASQATSQPSPGSRRLFVPPPLNR